MKKLISARPKQDPKIEVSNLRLSSHRCRPNHVAARVDITITGTSGVTRTWQNARLVFDGFWPIDGFPVGSYSLYVENQSRGGYKRGTRLIPPCWRRAAREFVYEAVAEAEDAQKKREAAEIAAGTRWPPLPWSALQVTRGGMQAWG